MAQSINPDGNQSTPLHSTDQIIYRRFDFGHVQAEDSFLVNNNVAITTWSYFPWAEFVDANGDGGEQYEIQGNRLVITYTKHLGIPTTHFAAPWTAASTDTMPCEQGWTQYSLLEQGCKTTVNYPNLGPVDTIISEHRTLDGSVMERIFLGRGWGRLAWQTFQPTGTTPADRCPDFGWNQFPGMILTDCRIVTNLEKETKNLTGSQLWHP